jgi:hypothetical protein
MTTRRVTSTSSAVEVGTSLARNRENGTRGRDDDGRGVSHSNVTARGTEDEDGGNGQNLVPFEQQSSLISGSSSNAVVGGGDGHGMTITGGGFGPASGGLSPGMPSSPFGYYGGGPTAASMMMMTPPPLPYMAGLAGGVGVWPLTGLYQTMYGIQNVVLSLSQAVQLVGMNKQLLQQAWESLSQMVDHAIATFSELRTLEVMERQHETEEEKQRRRRLKALRYALAFGGGWLAYKLIRSLLLFTSMDPSRRRRLRQHQQRQFGNNTAGTTMELHAPHTLTPYMTNNPYPNGTSSAWPSLSPNAGYPYASYGMEGSGRGYPGYYY